MTTPEFDSTATRFSTEKLPDRERLPLLREVVGRLVKMEMEPLPDRPLHYDGRFRLLPGLTICSGAHSGIRIQRSPSLAAKADDAVVLCTSFAAGHTITQLGREVTTNAGEAVLVSGTDPGWAALASTSRCLNLSFSRRILSTMVVGLEDAFLRPVPKESEALGLLATYVNVLERDHVLASPELRHAAVTHIYDLVALALGPTRDAAEIVRHRGGRAARLHAIKADILARLTDADLSIAVVARRHGVGPRYVQMLFETEGTTFSQFLLEQRLSRSHRMLGDARLASHKIATVAFDTGFGDLSYFNRAFRRRYGQSPSDVRAAAQHR